MSAAKDLEDGGLLPGPQKTSADALRTRVRNADRESSASGQAGLEPPQLWDLHGRSVYALALALLGNQAAVKRAVTWGLVDLFIAREKEHGPHVDDSLRTVARFVYRRCEESLRHRVRAEAATVPPLMVWLGELAEQQRASLVLCVFGGHTRREAAGLLGIPAEVVAALLTSGLLELHDLATGRPGHSALPQM